jgi:hypothetical protein
MDKKSGSGINIPDPQHCLWQTDPDTDPGGPKTYGSTKLPNTQDLPVGAAECWWAGAGPHVVHHLAHTPQLTLVAAGGKGALGAEFFCLLPFEGTFTSFF